jgi:peptidoglycan-associated lipoprotein
MFAKLLLSIHYIRGKDLNMMLKKLSPWLLLALAACECADDSCQRVETNLSAVAPGTAADFTQNVPDTLYFGFNKANVTADGEKIIEQQSRWLKTYASTTATVEGHCDARGSREYNLALGDKRANAVKLKLEKNGVAADRLSSISYGKDKLKDTEARTEEAHAVNRRAVTVIN